MFHDINGSTSRILINGTENVQPIGTRRKNCCWRVRLEISWPHCRRHLENVSVNCVSASLLHSELLWCRAKNMLPFREGGGWRGGRCGGVLLALLHSCSVVNIFILSVRAGIVERGTSHSGSAVLCDLSGWCNSKKHLHLHYGSPLISSSEASALFFPRARWSLTAHFHVSPSHVPAPLRIRSSLRFRTQSPNSLTCQSLWTWAGLSHQVCLPCVLMTPLSQFITYLSLPAEIPMTEPSAGLSVRNGTVGVVIEVKSSRRDDGTRAERSAAQQSGFQSEEFSQLKRSKFKLK